MLVRIGVAAAMALAASTVVFAGEAAAKGGRCASDQPRWNYVCVEAASDVAWATCEKDAPNWARYWVCAARTDGSNRYDLWIPNPR
ncbi:hypothetical protein DMB37_07425 [Nocardia sp. CS682]|nr:hypothetical protein DMB37_07425 [Nocardia sp. CS682]